MIDDIRIAVDIKNDVRNEVEIQCSQKNRKPKRLKFLGKRDRSIRVRSIRKGTQLVFEGSFAGYLQGHNIVGTMNLTPLVEAVVLKILRRMKIKPSPDEFAKIKTGDIKLERLDVVGYKRCSSMGGPSTVVNCLDAGLVGSKEIRFVAPNETLVYHMRSSYWSLMVYNKALQMKKFYPEAWKKFDPALRLFAQKYARIELRQHRKELLQHKITKVKDATEEKIKAMFSARLEQMIDDLNVTDIHFPVVGKKPDTNEMLARLYASGIDFISRYSTGTQSRIWTDIERRFGMKKGRMNPLPPPAFKTLSEFKDVQCQHGIPKKLQDLKGLFNFDR
jgi:hypothetical protein